MTTPANVSEGASAPYDEAVGDAQVRALLEECRLHMEGKLSTPSAREVTLSRINEALSARTAAPAEQGVSDAQVEAACAAMFGDGWKFAERQDSVAFAKENLRRALEAARLAPIAPAGSGSSSRSVDGLSGEANMLASPEIDALIRGWQQQTAAQNESEWAKGYRGGLHDAGNMLGILRDRIRRLAGRS